MTQRALEIIPIIHTQADLGRLGPSVRRVTEERHGHGAWDRTQQAIDTVWDEIDRYTDALIERGAGSVRIYQDGLPVCGRELDIVRELAEKGSRNHIMLARLIDAGATIEGTESPELLLKEYEAIKAALAGQSDPTRADKSGLIHDRDRFIADRIRETLTPTDTGVLLIGMLHDVAPLLPTDIEVRTPIEWSKGAA